MPKLEERVSIRYTVEELVKRGVLPDDADLLFGTTVVNNQGELMVEFIVRAKAIQVPAIENKEVK